MGAAKSATIQSAVHKVPELGHGMIALAETELDELVKIDLEELAGLIDANGFGPNMSVDAKCPKGHKFVSPIDWRYDSFFGISSPPQE